MSQCPHDGLLCLDRAGGIVKRTAPDECRWRYERPGGMDINYCIKRREAIARNPQMYAPQVREPTVIAGAERTEDKDGK